MADITRMIKLFKTPVPRLRASLARAAGSYITYKAFIESIMKDEDGRVRANAVEALWQADPTKARSYLTAAAEDPHPRVRTNALLGLFYCDRPAAIDALILQGRNGSPQLRASAAWAMGQTKAALFRDSLQELLNDNDENVKTQATRSLNLLSEQTEDAGKSTATAEVSETNTQDEEPAQVGPQ